MKKQIKVNCAECNAVMSYKDSKITEVESECTYICPNCNGVMTIKVCKNEI